MNTVVCKTKDEAIEKFKEFSLKFLSDVKTISSDRYSVADNLSFVEYAELAKKEGESLSVGYLSKDDEDFTVSIVNTIPTQNGYDEETFIIHMYPCVFGERDFSILSPVLNAEEEADAFYELLTGCN